MNDYTIYDTGINYGELLVSTQNIITVTDAIRLTLNCGVAPFRFVVKDNIVYGLDIGKINFSIDLNEGFLLNNNLQLDYYLKTGA